MVAALTRVDSAVTAVLPVWDGYVSYLPAAVANARAQGTGHIVIVDNASRVPVPEVEGAVYVRLRDRVSVGEARNAGLDVVKTRYVVFHDVDDEVMDGTWRRLAAILDSDPDFVLAMSAAIKRNELGETWERYVPPAAYLLARLPKTVVLVNVVFNVLMTNGGTLMRADVVREAGGFGTTSFGEDWSLSSIMALRGRVHVDREPGWYWELHDGSLWNRDQRVEELEIAARAVMDRVRRDPAATWWIRAWLRVAPIVLRWRLRRLSAGGSVVRPDLRPPGTR